MSTVGALHDSLVFSRRTQVLARELERAIPQGTDTILDVGCGDGTIDRLIFQRRAGLQITGVDVLVRPETHIPVIRFDGTRLPFADRSFDVVMFVDVLHHTIDPLVLLREAARVARKAVVLKDHTQDSRLSRPILRFMDWVGNAHHGVELPYNYWSTPQWNHAFESLGLKTESWASQLGLYPFPASLVFERKLHFVARLAVQAL